MCLVCVVIPTYNAENYLGACLASLIAQSLPDWQAVVVDDGSRDGTLNVARQYAEQDSRIQVKAFENGGVAVARNRGMALAPDNARYLLFLDNDDFLAPDALEVLTRCLEENPDAVAAYGLPRDVDKEGNPLSADITKSFGYVRQEVVGRKLEHVADDRATTFASLVVWPCIVTPGQVLLRAQALKEAGAFDQSTAPSDDWDMWLRLSKYGEFKFIRRYVMNKRSHGENVSSKGKVMAVAEPVIRRKLTDPTMFTPQQRTLAKAGHRYSCLVKLTWASGELQKGHVVSAMKNVYRAGKSYVAYRNVWRGK